MSREEQLLRETVRGMLSEAGFGDVRAAEDRMEKEEAAKALALSKLPKQESIDSILAWSGIGSDAAGFALNFFKGAWWADAANVLLDFTSLMFAVMQWSRAKSRLDEAQAADLTALDQRTRDRVLLIYEFDYRVAVFMVILSIINVPVSIAAAAGKQIASGVELGLKLAKWSAFGLSVIDATSGAANAEAKIEEQMSKIRAWLNSPATQALISGADALQALAESERGRRTIAIMSIASILETPIDPEQIKQAVDALPDTVSWLKTAKTRADKLA
jgi:hypothetical protein